MSETPILELEQAPPEPPSVWLGTLIGVALGSIIAAIMIMDDHNRLPRWHWPAFNGLLFFPALYVAIAFHEIGHLVAGKVAGLNTSSISVGPFSVAKAGKNWIFRFERRMCIVGGVFTPFTRIDVPPNRYAWLVAGGPLASLALTLLCGLVFIRYGSGLWSWIGSLFWMSLFTVMISAIPFSSGLQKSDGARLWQLIRHPERARSWMALLALHTENAKGLRPCEWNPQLFEQILTTDPSAGEYLHSQLVAFYRRLDDGLDGEALVHLENVLARSARVGKTLRQALFLEAASANANIRKQPDKSSYLARSCMQATEAGVSARDRSRNSNV